MSISRLDVIGRANEMRRITVTNRFALREHADVMYQTNDAQPSTARHQGHLHLPSNNSSIESSRLNYYIGLLAAAARLLRCRDAEFLSVYASFKWPCPAKVSPFPNTLVIMKITAGNLYRRWQCRCQIRRMRMQIAVPLYEKTRAHYQIFLRTSFARHSDDSLQFEITA